MKNFRIALVVLGVVGIVWGGWLLVSSQRPEQWLNALVWLAAVVIVHDGVLMPLLAIRRFTRARRAKTPQE